MVVELSMQYSRTFFYDSFETYKTFQIHDLNVDFALKLSNYTIYIFETFYMSQMNPIEFVHNTAYSV